MEVYAGFLTHTDAEVGRLLDFVDELGELDDTVVLVMSDNGASAEGGPRGSFNEMYFFNFEPENMAENLARIDQLGGPEAYNHYPGLGLGREHAAQALEARDPRRRVCDPLIVHWPRKLGRPGDTRQQYVHAVDVMPTLLELIGIDPPDEINGVPQRPIEGVSFAPALWDPSHPGQHLTQYYEMLGSRAITTMVGRRSSSGRFPSSTTPSRTIPFDPSRRTTRELYHVAEDFSETRDLAAEHPDKLAELVDLWWREAERFQVLPVTNIPIVGVDPRYRRARYVFYPGIGTIPQLVAPNISNRAWSLRAELVVPDDGADGVIVGHGSHAGGYVVFLRNGRLHFTYNHLGTTLTTVAAEVVLPTVRSWPASSSRPPGPMPGTSTSATATCPWGRATFPGPPW